MDVSYRHTITTKPSRSAKKLHFRRGISTLGKYHSPLNQSTVLLSEFAHRYIFAPICRQKAVVGVHRENSPDETYSVYFSFGELRNVQLMLPFHGKSIYWCCGLNKSCTTFTGEKVEIGTSTKMVFQSAIAPFQRPGSSCARRSRPPLDFEEIKPVAGSV